MRNVLGAVADRLVGLVVPRTTAAACACNDWVDHCIGHELVRCYYDCWCNLRRCEGIGSC